MIDLTQWLTQLDMRSDIDRFLVTESENNLLIRAGPGTGKTRLLTIKAAYLLSKQTDSGRGFACLTYSRRLARTIRHTISDIGKNSNGNTFVGTLHSFCLTEIIQPYERMFGLEIAQQLGETFTLRIASSAFVKQLQKITFDKLGLTITENEFSAYRNTVYLDERLGEIIDQSLIQKNLHEAVSHYEKRLKFHSEGRFVDFDMLLRAALHLLKTQETVRVAIHARFPWFLIDEYQDLGYPLHRFVQILTAQAQLSAPRIFAVGDPQQCIYQFLGARAEYFEELAERIPYVALTENYRHSRSIFAVLHRLSNVDSVGKSASEGFSICVDCTKPPKPFEAIVATMVDWLTTKWHAQPKDILILCQKRIEALFVCKAITTTRVRLLTHPDYHNATHLMSWLDQVSLWCISSAPNENISYENILDGWLNLLQLGQLALTSTDRQAQRAKLFRVLKNITQPDCLLCDWFQQLEESLGLSQLVEQFGQFSPDDADEYTQFKVKLQNNDRLAQMLLKDFGTDSGLVDEIRVCTIHGSKGLEARYTITIGLDQLSTGDQASQNLLYVACSRAQTGSIHLVRNTRHKLIKVHQDIADKPQVKLVSHQSFAQMTQSITSF